MKRFLSRLLAIALFAIWLLLPSWAWAAARFWVGGTGSWDGATTTHWSATTGGSGGSSAPGTGDSVTIDASSGAGTITVVAGAACASLDTTNSTNTIAGSQALTISAGGLVWGSGITLTYTGGLTFADTSGTTRTITTNGKTVAGITINGAGGVFQLADAITSSGILTVTTGSFDFNSKSAQFASVAYNGAGTKSVLLGNSQITITGTGNAWNANATGTTQTTGGSSKITFNNSSSSAKTFTGQTLTFDTLEFAGSGSGAYTLSYSGTAMNTFKVSAASSTGVTISSTATFVNVDFTGFTGALTQSNQINVKGNLTFNGTMTTASTSNINLTGTSGTQTITSGGFQAAQGLLVNNAGATATLADAFHTTGLFTLTAGTFTSNGQALTASGILSSNSNTRSLTLDNSAVTLSGSGTPLNLATTTGLTFSATASSIAITDASASSKALSWNALTLGDVTLSGSGAGAYTFTCNSGGMRDLTVSNTGGATLTTSGSNIQTRDINFTGFTGTFANGTNFKISGNLTAGSGMTWSDHQRHTFNATSGTKTITTNGVQINGQFEFDGVGGEWHLADDLTFAGLNVPSLRLVNGTFRTMGHNMQGQEFDGSTGTPGPWVFDFSGSTIHASNNLDPWYFPTITDWGASIVSTGSTIILDDSDSSGSFSKRFNTGGATYNNLVLGGTGSNQFQIHQSGTFTGTVSDVDTATHSVFFDASSTTVMAAFQFVGSATNTISLRSSATNTAFTLSVASGDSVNDYLDVQDTTVTGGARWFAGRHSVNSGNNHGWRFTDRYRSPVTSALLPSMPASDVEPVLVVDEMEISSAAAYRPVDGEGVAARLDETRRHASSVLRSGGMDCPFPVPTHDGDRRRSYADACGGKATQPPDVVAHAGILARAPANDVAPIAVGF